ncbi:P27 family phage terminase small subunit [Arthrobacter sp. 08Y14]|uniref:P27 family phage terminase small subunit n=1 Tax=Arthrobacter sp. 08Y14 TaxID=2058885 RepID=UPI000CE324CB|nr:P27 family phage terminase small subunit [Arthrobacter sp. 08Y14]
MDAASAAALYEACNLLAIADHMEERVNEDGLMISGSSGQMVPNGLLSEIRLARVQAIAALKSFGVSPGQSGASRAGAALAMKRHHGRTPGVRVIG